MTSHWTKIHLLHCGVHMWFVHFSPLNSYSKGASLNPLPSDCGSMTKSLFVNTRLQSKPPSVPMLSLFFLPAHLSLHQWYRGVTVTVMASAFMSTSSSAPPHKVLVLHHSNITEVSQIMCVCPMFYFFIRLLADWVKSGDLTCLQFFNI